MAELSINRSNSAASLWLTGFIMRDNILQPLASTSKQCEQDDGRMCRGHPHHMFYDLSVHSAQKWCPAEKSN